MEESVRQRYDESRDFSRKTFHSGCYAPFVSLYFNTLGDVVACCKSQTYVLGNISRQRLNDIWRGEKIRALRRALTDYRFEGSCEFCEWDITGGGFQGAYPRVFENFPVESMEPEWPAVIEFSGSNTCNFECVMCFGELSSSIRAHREGLPPLMKAYSEEFFEDLRRFLPHLHLARFFGGEPFLARECYKIWDMMIEDGLNIPCHVTTNGSQYNAKVERILEALPVSFSISVDGATKETVEKIRVNSRYEELIDHLHKFLDYTKRRGTYLGLTYCLMRQNWHEFGDFLLFAESIGCDVFVNTVIDPSHCSLYTLTPNELTRIVDKMEDFGILIKDRLRRNRQTWEFTIAKLRNSANERQVQGVAGIKKAAFEARRNGEEGTRSHVSAAWGLVEKGLYAEALEEVLKTPEADPFYYFALILCAHIRRLLGDLAGAEVDLIRAINMSQRRADPFIDLAWIRLDQGKIEDGLMESLRALELIKEGDKRESEIYELLGLLHDRLRKASNMRQVLDRLLKLQPDNPKSRVKQGLAILTTRLRADDIVESND